MKMVCPRSFFSRRKGLLNSLIAITAVMILTVLLTLYPEEGTRLSGRLFLLLTRSMGTPILLFTLAAFTAVILLACSKYGHIRLGAAPPEYSILRYITMIVTTGFGSGTIYWGFMEWAHYYVTPPFGLTPRSIEAAEWATAYNMFHWGFTAWGLFTLASLPVAYAYHVRNNPELKLSSLSASFVPTPFKKPVTFLTDQLYILATVSGIAIVMGLGVPVISAGLRELTGWPDSFLLQGGIIILISLLLTAASFYGLEKGLKWVSARAIGLLMVFLLYIFCCGPSAFILDQGATGLGLMLQNMLRMSLGADAVRGGGFPQNWTVWFWSYWLIYTPFIGAFITRISRGRTIREMTLCLLLGGSAGVFVFFAIVGGFSMHADLTGTVPVSRLLEEGHSYRAIILLIGSLPLPRFSLGFFTFLTVLLQAVNLVGSTFSLTVNTTRPDAHGNPTRRNLILWCLVLTLIPLTLLYIEAPLKTIQIFSLGLSIPLIFLLSLLSWGTVRQIRHDFGEKSRHEIFVESRPGSWGTDG